MEFYKNVIKNALIIFLIAILFISVIIVLSKDQYPQIVTPCPDHWVYKDGSCNNVHNIGPETSIKIGNYYYSCMVEGDTDNPDATGKPFSDPWWNSNSGNANRIWAQRCKQP